MKGAMFVKISSKISPNSTRFSVNMERVQRYQESKWKKKEKKNVIHSTPRGAILKNEGTLKGTVYLHFKLVVEEVVLKNTVEIFSITMQEETVL